MSVVEKQMIAHDDDDDESDEHNNQIVISTQVNVNETTNAVRTIAVPNQHHHQQQQQQQHQQHPHLNSQQKHQSIHTKNLSVARHLSDNDENEYDNSEIPDNSYCTFTQETQRRFLCVNRLLQIIFSTPGLVILVVIYSIMGALIFPLLEVPQDITQSSEIVKSREECLRELWSITEKLNVLYERNWTMLVHEQLRLFEGSIVSATRKATPGSNLISGTRGSINLGSTIHAEQMGWSFSEALLYSVTVITTIGHGSLTPKTPAGKIATILYALIGVPLMLMCLSSLGVLLANALQYTYTKLSCQTGRTESSTSQSTKVPTLTRQQLQDNISQRPQSRSQQPYLSSPLASACHVGDSPKPKVPDTSDQFEHNMKLESCEGCKYDAIMNVSQNPQNDCIKYREHNVEEKSQILTGHKLYNSTNNDAFPQTTFVNVPFAQQQQHHHHHKNLKLEPSIMLMPLTSSNAYKSTTIVTAPNTTTTTSSLHTFNEGATTTTTTTNQGTQVYINTPQFFSRPMQTIRIAISPQASKTTTMEENAIKAKTTAATSTLPRFVAVPSSMVRLEQQSLTTSNNCHFILPQHAHNYTSIVKPPTIYFPMTATTTLPRAGLTQTLHRYETLSPQQHVNTTIGTFTTTTTTTATTAGSESTIITFPKAINSPIGTRRTNVLTNPLSPELNALRKTALLVQTSTNGRESMSNTKITNLPLPLPTEHAVDCKVAIMEDEEENEQKRLGNCPYGTPSRVPLIRSSMVGADNCSRNSLVKDNSLKAKRERLGASFHRHTFNTFQRNSSNSNNSAGTYMKPQSSEVSNSVKRNKRNYCVDVVEGSDDDNDEYMVQHGSSSGCYMLNRLDTLADNVDDTEEHDSHSDTPQIPISIVVLLLICYICLGAGIFALWENWSLIDGAYFCFVTLTTIGYGDFVPEHVLKAANIHLFTFCAYLLIGLILVAMSLSILETQLLWKCKRIAVRLKLMN